MTLSCRLAFEDGGRIAVVMVVLWAFLKAVT